MKVSLNTVKQYADVDLGIGELVDKINQQLGGVEEVIDLGERYKDAVVVKIISAEQHPNADRLRICKIDDNHRRDNVERDEQGYVQVVCGAPNARAGIFVVWLPPESTVPASYAEKELFVLNSRELRGVMSHGMLAAADELAIGSDHDGILEITDTDLPPQLSNRAIEAGLGFAELFGLDDMIIDIENKMFTHRPDCFGQLGVAREISAITKEVTDAAAGFVDEEFQNPDWYRESPVFEHANDELELTVANNAPDKVARFMAVAMSNVTIGPSPLWLQAELVRFGSKPINNVVDITNYIMLLTAQPVHAYDYDKLDGHTLGARLAVTGEKVTLLNHKDYELTGDDIVIYDGNGPVGLAGIMGGGESEVSSTTTRIVLEVATFDMYAVRKTSMRHGIFTDALTRFNKGQSPLQNDRILKRLMTLIKEIAGGAQASRVFDESEPDTVAAESLSGELRISAEFINARLGSSLTAPQMASLLRRTNFSVQLAEDDQETMLITAPFWRTDIELPEDIVEEVGRLYGFSKLPRELPQRSIIPAPVNVDRQLAQTIRQSLSRAGANEVLTYSFVHENVLVRAGLDPTQAFKLGNALSPELQYYRLSLTPSLLDKVHANSKAGYDEFAIFEIGKAHSKLSIDPVDGLPVELARLGLTYAATQIQPGAAYYKVKAMLEYLAKDLGLQLVYKPLPIETTLAVAAPFEPRRSARVVDRVSGQSLGVIGEYRRAVSKQFKLPSYSAGLELLPEAILLAQAHHAGAYLPLSKFPSTERDICFQVDTQVAYAAVVTAARDALDLIELMSDISPVDIYHAPETESKNITIRIKLSASDRTLVGDEVAAVIRQVADTVIEQTGAAVV